MVNCCRTPGCFRVAVLARVLGIYVPYRPSLGLNAVMAETSAPQNRPVVQIKWDPCLCRMAVTASVSAQYMAFNLARFNRIVVTGITILCNPIMAEGGRDPCVRGMAFFAGIAAWNMVNAFPLG